MRTTLTTRFRTLTNNVAARAALLTSSGLVMLLVETAGGKLP
jgi:hypothetical protein